MEDNYTILCVDDEEFIVKALSKTLSLEGYNTLTALNGKEALEVLGKEHVDLVITDQRMPVMDGSALLRQIKQKYTHVISIMLSAYSDFDSLVHAVNEGEVFHFFSKPWEDGELKRVVRLALEHKRIVNIIENLVREASKIFDLPQGVSVDVSSDSSSIVLKLGEKIKEVSDDLVFKFLEFIFESLGVSKADDLKVVSGLITKQRGVIVITLDMIGGMNLKIELPRVDN